MIDTEVIVDGCAVSAALMLTTSVVKFGARFLRKPKALLLLHRVEAIQKKRLNDTKIVISSSDKQGRAECFEKHIES